MREEDGLSLRTYLLKKKDVSRRLLTDIKFAGGQLRVNNNLCTVRHRLTQGDEVKVVFPPEHISETIPESSLNLTIVYEDDHLLVVDKPAGVSTIPSRDPEADSIAGAVLAYYSQIGWPATFHAVNRLDKETSGLMIVAKHRYAHDQFVKKQRLFAVKRRYTALVQGDIPWFAGVIEAPIARSDHSIIERTVAKNGKKAKTAYTAAARDKDKKVSLLHVSLYTGRTHQIRVHFAWLGHPLIGDSLYGKQTNHTNGHLLHAAEIAFIHPFTGKEHRFTSSLPERFTTCSLYPSQHKGH